MHTLLFGALAQIKTLDSATPRIPDAPSLVPLWIMIAILVVAILLITFKIAKRNQNVLDE